MHYITEPEPKLYGEIEEIQDQVERRFQQFMNFNILSYYNHGHHFHYRRGRPRIESEWELIRTKLPPPEVNKELSGSIFVRVYDQRNDLMSVMIVGKESSPYHQGLFFFDIFFPSNYPQETEDVFSIFYHSFGVDLHLQFRKDKREACKNTLELLSSLKDMVVNDKSHNIIHSQKGMKLFKNLVASDKSYIVHPQKGMINRKVFMQTFEAMLKMLKCPSVPFKDFVLGYFRTRAHDILLNYKGWADLEDDAMKTLFFKLVRAFEANGTYCRHHYIQKEYDQAKQHEEELLNQIREKTNGHKARDWLPFGVQYTV